MLIRLLTLAMLSACQPILYGVTEQALLPCEEVPTLGNAGPHLLNWAAGVCGPLPGNRTYTVETAHTTGVEVGLTLAALYELEGTPSTTPGACPTTSINFVGSVHGDWRGIRMGEGSVIRHMTLSGADMITDDEQSHLVEAYRAEDVRIENSCLYHPEKPSVTAEWPAKMPAGDCVRFIGEEGHPTGGVVRQNHFLWCDRSGVALQRGTHGLLIEDNLFEETGDAAIDSEQTNGGGSNIVIRRNELRDISVKGIPCVSLSAQPGPLSNLLVEDNWFRGCGLDALNAVDLTIRGNAIEHVGAGPAVAIKKESDGVLLEYNLIVKGTATNHPAIEVTHLNEGFPGDVVLRGNQIESRGPAPVFSGYNLTSLLVEDNSMFGEGGAGVRLQGLDRPVTASVVQRNSFVGPIPKCTRHVNVSSVTVVDNSWLLEVDPEEGAPTGTPCVFQ